MTIYNFTRSSKISLSLSPIASSINESDNISPTHDSNCYKRKKGSSPRLVNRARFVSFSYYYGRFLTISLSLIEASGYFAGRVIAYKRRGPGDG